MMKTIVETNMVQNPKISVSFSDTGDLEHQLTFKCVLKPGDTDRLIQMFKERVKYGIPITLAVSSPQSRMDLKVTAVEDTKPSKKESIEPDIEAVEETRSNHTPLSFFKVECEILEGQNHPYRVKIDDLFEGQGDSARDAVIIALIGSANINFKTGKGPVVKDLTAWLRDNHPANDELEKLCYILEHDTFEVPVKV